MWSPVKLGMATGHKYHNVFLDAPLLSKGGEGGGQRVMIGIIIEVNDDNCGWPLRSSACPLL